MKLRLGTRASALALAQSGHVAEALRAHGHEVELVHVVTRGDTSTEAITQLGSTGVFVTALRDALLAGEVDLAVHSYKDLPTAPCEGLVIAAVPPRQDARDALVARDGLTLGELPAGSRVGTGSPRRTAQLLALGMGLDVVPVRGNVDTRVRMVSEGALDAVVLARAGLARLGRLGEVTETLDPLQMLPAPAQGALAIECPVGPLVEVLAVPTLDRQRSLGGRRQALQRIQRLGHLAEPAQPRETCTCQHDRVQGAVGDHADTGVDVAAHRDHVQTHPQGEQLRRTAG